jgi:quercetin dioxygenase-like cupin family protein
MDNLTEIVDQLLQDAGDASTGRASRTLIGGSHHQLRQTVVALRGGQELAEHASPGEATLQVLRGAVELRAGEDAHGLGVGDLAAIPDRSHSLAATEDAAVLLTVVKALG